MVSVWLCAFPFVLGVLTVQETCTDRWCLRGRVSSAHHLDGSGRSDGELTMASLKQELWSCSTNFEKTKHIHWNLGHLISPRLSGSQIAASRHSTHDSRNLWRCCSLGPMHPTESGPGLDWPSAGHLILSKVWEVLPHLWGC